MIDWFGSRRATDLILLAAIVLALGAGAVRLLAGA